MAGALAIGSLALGAAGLFMGMQAGQAQTQLAATQAQQQAEAERERIISQNEAMLAEIEAAQFRAETEAMELEAAARAASFNAQQADRQADFIQADTQEAVDRRLTEGQRMLARQRAVTAAQGRSLNGSPLHLLAETTEDTELDALSLRRRGTVEETNARTAAGFQRVREADVTAAAARTRARPYYLQLGDPGSVNDNSGLIRQAGNLATGARFFSGAGQLGGQAYGYFGSNA